MTETGIATSTTDSEADIRSKRLTDVRFAYFPFKQGGYRRGLYRVWGALIKGKKSHVKGVLKAVLPFSNVRLIFCPKIKDFSLYSFLPIIFVL